MRLSLLLPCTVIGGLIGVSVFGQSGEEPAPTEESFGNPISEAVEEPALPQPQSFNRPSHPPTAESVVQEEQELRRQYRELMELKSGLMDRSELRAAINGAVEDINQLRAAEKLDEARENLLELVKMHPQTKAAAAARNMLQVRPEGPFVPTRDTPNGPYTAPSDGQILIPRGTYEPSSNRRKKAPTVDPTKARISLPTPPNS